MRTCCTFFCLLVLSVSTVQGQAPSFAPQAQSFSLDGQSGNASSVWIGDVERYEGEDARKMIVAKDRYVRVTYRKEDGKTEIAEGFVRAMDETELTIYQGGLRKRIAREKIVVLMVCDYPSQLQRAETSIVTPASGITHRIGMMDPNSRIAMKAGSGLTVGVLLSILGFHAGVHIVDDNCETLACAYGKGAIGLLAGYTIGVATGVSMVDAYDQFTSSFVGSFIGAGAGIGLAYVDVELSAVAVLAFPIIGALIGSELSRRPPDASYFSVGVVPHSNDRIAVAATLRF